MKTKEDLLKIYSAYLPYRIIVKKKFGRYSPTKNEEMTIDDLKTFSMSRIFMPHLYSMDMLTKEIEHKGERFIPIVELEIIFNDDIEIDSEDTFLIGKKGNGQILLGVEEMPYIVVKKLLEWHFNVFGLDESEYIKK